MKVGILSLTLDANYGGILQAYALQNVLKRMGHESFLYNLPYNRRSKTSIYISFKRVIKKLLGQDILVFKEYKNWKEAPVTKKELWRFRKKYIRELIISNIKEIKESDIDCIVVGSDQVWRSLYFKKQWRTGIENAFLAFTKGWNIKRISYAASFGVDIWEYCDKETEKVLEAVKMFDALSVRESSAISLLRSHVHINSIQTLDPTFLLDKVDYMKIVDANYTPRSEGDLLVYLLDYNKDKDSLIKRIIEDKELTPFRVNRSGIKPAAPIAERVLPSVESWIRGFNDAVFVVTDSFHACAFSILFRKPFIVIENEQRGEARILSLLTLFSMNHRLIKKRDLNCFSIDNSLYSLSGDEITKIDEVLERERRISIDFLSNALTNPQTNE